MTVLEVESARVNCPEHGVLETSEPGTRHGSRCSRTLAERAARLAAHSAQNTVATLLPVTCRSMVGIVSRVVAAAESALNPFAYLAWIGFVEMRSHASAHR